MSHIHSCPVIHEENARSKGWITDGCIQSCFKRNKKPHRCSIHTQGFFLFCGCFIISFICIICQDVLKCLLFNIQFVLPLKPWVLKMNLGCPKPMSIWHELCSFRCQRCSKVWYSENWDDGLTVPVSEVFKPAVLETHIIDLSSCHFICNLAVHKKSS